MIRTTWQVFKAALNEAADVYHFHDPELIPIGVLLKLFGKRVIYDVHEDISQDILSKNYIPAFLRKPVAGIAGFTEHITSKVFDGIVAATPAIAKHFAPSKTVTVQNFPILNDAASSTGRPYCERSFIVTYVGGITRVRGIEEMVRAVAMVPQSMNPKLVLAAEFQPPELEREVKQLPGWDRVDFLGWRSTEEVASILGQARVGLVLFHPIPNHMEAQPHKFFDYMSAGIPLIVSDFPLWREIVQGVGCGILVDPLNPTAIAEAIKWLFEHPEEAERMGRRGKEAATSRFNWEKEAAKLIGLYQELQPVNA